MTCDTSWSSFSWSFRLLPLRSKSSTLTTDTRWVRLKMNTKICIGRKLQTLFSTRGSISTYWGSATIISWLIRKMRIAPCSGSTSYWQLSSPTLCSWTCWLLLWATPLTDLPKRNKGMALSSKRKWSLTLCKTCQSIKASTRIATCLSFRRLHRKRSRRMFGKADTTESRRPSLRWKSDKRPLLSVKCETSPIKWKIFSVYCTLWQTCSVEPNKPSNFKRRNVQSLITTIRTIKKQSKKMWRRACKKKC
jgi:hypothetical protein